jgi:CheY-like chemotaxis protein/HPt (histidine-containing phosphotransfer) domain-containing protein
MNHASARGAVRFKYLSYSQCYSLIPTRGAGTLKYVSICWNENCRRGKTRQSSLLRLFLCNGGTFGVSPFSAQLTRRQMVRSTRPRAVSEQQPDNRYAPSHEENALRHGRERRAAGAALRLLYVDDEPDIREVVELSLALDPAFTVRSCATAGEALTAAAEWRPDLVLCDVMMPGMDGPALLARLRENPQTARIPVVFMTARVQTRELEHFKSLGAAGVIAKPFDPMTLAASLRKHLRAAGLAALRGGFMRRLQADAQALAQWRFALADSGASHAALEQINTFAHALAGAAGIFGFAEISRAAARLERIAETSCGSDGLDKVEQALDVLLRCIEQAPGNGTD